MIQKILPHGLKEYTVLYIFPTTKDLEAVTAKLRDLKEVNLKMQRITRIMVMVSYLSSV